MTASHDSRLHGSVALDQIQRDDLCTLRVRAPESVLGIAADAVASLQ
jgi:hypothetical protein